MSRDFHALLDQLKSAHDQDVASLRHEIDLLTAEKAQVQRDLVQNREVHQQVASAPEGQAVDGVAGADKSNRENGMDAEDEVPATPPRSSPRPSWFSAKSGEEVTTLEALPVSQQRVSQVLYAQQGSKSQGTLDNSVSEHWRRKIHQRDSRRTLPHRFFSADKQKQAQLLVKIVSSKYYEMLVIFMVFLNAVFIGVEVQYFSQHYRMIPFRDIVEAAFTLVFTVELSLRLYVQRRQFFAVTSPDFAWNLFDLFVVALMVCDFILLHVTAADTNTLSNFSVLRVIRILRVTRAFRVIRLLKFFRELRLMISSMMTSLKPLMWTMLVLMVLFYIFGIMLAQGTSFYCSDARDACVTSEGRRLQERFGSLDTSILSLFEAMSNGVSWGILYDILRPLNFSYRLVFIVYISFALFAMVNVVTSVFVDGAVQSSNRDHDNLIQEELRHKEEYIASMHTLFIEMDDDNSGFISLDEFRQAIHDERIVAYFHVLGLAIEDVETLFVLLDRDRTGAIDIEEFLLGCMKLKGEAKSLDLAKLTYESEWLVHNFDDLRQCVSNLTKVVGELPRHPTSSPLLANGKPEKLGDSKLEQAACGQPPEFDGQRARL
mmetsp:Transcript_66684/g.168165  ORF Transcript_66684/g.168165 Transcript_66684/m.168165 type:complete len:602 (-) Transcript_66684:148-1953(-)